MGFQTDFPSQTSHRPMQEFRLDFILEEEFGVDSSFAQKFIEACGWTLCSAVVDRVILQPNETICIPDVLVLISARNSQGKAIKAAILIEDKLTASPQPRQCERYLELGETGKNNGRWDEYRTVLVASKHYEERYPSEYQAFVSIEMVKEFICTGEPRRRDFKLDRLNDAIAKSQATGVQVVNRDMTEFRKHYYKFRGEFNAVHETDFAMRAPADTYIGDTWFRLRSSRLADDMHIRHIASHGAVDASHGSVELIIPGVDLAGTEALIPLFGRDSFTLRPYGKTGIRIGTKVQGIARFDDFASAQPVVENALKLAMALCDTYSREKIQIDALLRSARSANHHPA